MLLGASYFFYMSWKVEYALLIMFSTVVDFFAAQFIAASQAKLKRKLWLSASLITNLGLLGVFKYYNFFSSELESLLVEHNTESLFPVLSLALPVGISFYTFQTLSYTLDVYYGRQQPEKDIGVFALYVSFFPQLVAGPIERFSHLGKQLKQHHFLDYKNIAQGGRLVLFGLFIKMSIADNLSDYVDQVYASHADYHSLSIATAAFFYSFQIYADFYGYSLIAVGAAKLLGIDIIDNFKSPYFASSITEFWKRWHISLTTWFREYLYLPLGGNRVRQNRWIFNILVVFVISGLWHGANWTFIIWGTIHGLVYLLERFLRSPGKKSEPVRPVWLFWLNRIKTFTIVTIAWVFFRAEDLAHAKDFLSSLINNYDVQDSFAVKPQVWILLLLFIVMDYVLRNTRFDRWIDNKALGARWSVYALMLFGLMALGGVTNHPFIYFQF